MNRSLYSILAAFLLATGSQDAPADFHQGQEVREFIDGMVTRYGFNEQQLMSVFSRAKVSDTVLEAISRPAEALPWYRYRPIFLREDRIRLGSEFLNQYQAALARAEQVFGVPPEIIAAIIGVETRYGQVKGSYKVIDSLITLGFQYPKRGAFFRGELEHFLLLTREQKLDPLTVMGSYAGAMGIPQFISSSYRSYAVDFDGDGAIDIWNNPVDAIGSVANYFSRHGWKRGESIAVRANASGSHFQQLLGSDLQPDMTMEQLADSGVTPVSGKEHPGRAKLMSFQVEDGEELWLGLDNFYVITRYNHSALYAMAVFQLAEEIVRQSGKGAVSLND